MIKNKLKYIYGPVYSWRMGMSLGIDPITTKKKIFSEMIFNPLPINYLYLEPNELKIHMRDREVIQLQPYSAPNIADRILDKGGKPAINFLEKKQNKDTGIKQVKSQ